MAMAAMVSTEGTGVKAEKREAEKVAVERVVVQLVGLMAAAG